MTKVKSFINAKYFKKIEISVFYSSMLFFVLHFVRAILTGEHPGVLVYESITGSPFLSLAGMMFLFAIFYIRHGDIRDSIYIHFEFFGTSLFLMALYGFAMIVRDYGHLLNNRSFNQVEIFFASNHGMVIISCLFLWYLSAKISESLINDWSVDNGYLDENFKIYSQSIENLEGRIRSIEANGGVFSDFSHAWIYDKNSRVSSEWVTKASEGHWVTIIHNHKSGDFLVKHKRSYSNFNSRTFEQILQEDIEYNNKHVWDDEKEGLSEEDKRRFSKDGALYVPIKK